MLLLSRAAERAEKNRPSRRRDAHKDMWAVADTFGDVLDSIALPFPTQHRGGDGGVGAGITEALHHQAGVARRMREQQDSEDMAAEPSDIDHSAPAAATGLEVGSPPVCGRAYLTNQATIYSPPLRGVRGLSDRCPKGTPALGLLTRFSFRGLILHGGSSIEFYVYAIDLPW